MKKLFIIAMFFLFVISVSDALAYTKDCWIHKRVDPGEGFMHWASNKRGCDGFGDDCIIVPCDDAIQLGTIEEQAGGGWIITANVSNIQLQRLVNGNWIDVTNDGANYTFSEPEKLIIDKCDDYPALEGLQLDLTGITTDSNGNYTVYVPQL